MMELGFHSRRAGLVMQCVSSVVYQVKLNGTGLVR